MKLLVKDSSSAPPVLSDPTVCTSLAVVAPESAKSVKLDALLGSHGWGYRASADEVALPIDRLRHESIGGGCSASDFDAMIANAGSRGWLVDEGRSVLAHVEWQI